MNEMEMGHAMLGRNRWGLRRPGWGAMRSVIGPRAWEQAEAGWDRWERGGAGGILGTQEGRKAREEIAKLVDCFPELRASEVPEEVWLQARQGRDLTLSFCLWRIRQLEEMLLCRQRSRMMSTGSMNTMGEGAGGTLAAFWDAYRV